MKVAVIGAGLSGLSTAIALRKYVEPCLDEPLELKVYDETIPQAKHTVNHGWNDHADLRQRNQGAAISLQSNALRVLQDLDIALADRVRASGFPCKGFRWKSAGDYVLGNEYLDLLLISRPILIQCLQEALPHGTVEYRSAVSVEINKRSRPKISFDDGGSAEVDLVIGADGIRSPVRKSLLGDDPELHPQYCGHCAVGGVLEMQLDQNYFKNPMVDFIQGPNGFFGYCGLSQKTPDRLLYFSVFDSELPKRGEKLDTHLITTQLRERHKTYADPVIGKCLQEARIDNVYPIFYMPDLPSWGRDGCVLVGDAAHAMTPASGQGGSQAFEDAQTLALLLAGYLARDAMTKAVEKSIDALYDMRHERVYDLKAKGLQMKEPTRPWSLPVTVLVYATFCVLTKIKNVTSMLGMANPVLEWDAKVEVKKHFS